MSPSPSAALPPGAPPGDAATPSVADRVELFVFRVLVAAFGALPRRLALRVGAWLGDLVYFVDRRDRAVALFNLRLAFPERTPAQHRAILRESVRNLGRMAAECCHMHRLTPETIGAYVSFEDEAQWRTALAGVAERGALILTGHVGNWELLAYAHGLLGHPITLVHRPMNNALVDRAITDLRAGAGTVSLAKKTAAKAALRALHRKQLVAIPADQNQTRRYGVFVDFFGLPACTTPGPARLAMLSGAPVVPAFLIREGGSARHRIIILPPVEMVHSGDREADAIENTRRCTAVIEAVLRRYPEQWIWFHKRWKTRPPGEPRLYPQ